MKPVELPDDTQETLKEATRKAVKNAGGLLPVSALWGVSHQAVQATYSTNVEHMDRTTSLQRFVATVAFSGDTEPLQMIAGLFGKMLIDIPTAEAGHQAQKENALIKELSEAITATTGHDRQAKIKEAKEAALAALDYVASLESEPSNVTRIAGE